MNNLPTQEAAQPRTTRDVLRASGRVRPLSENLRCKIIPGVTLAEVRTILAQAPGPTLSEIILDIRCDESGAAGDEVKG